jgi:hypothetical protein
MRPPRNNEPMNTPSDKSEARDEIEAIAERAEQGEDVSAHFTNRHVAKQQVNIDFPLDLLRQIDAECARIGVQEDTPPKRPTYSAAVMWGNSSSTGPLRRCKVSDAAVVMSLMRQ